MGAYGKHIQLHMIFCHEVIIKRVEYRQSSAERQLGGVDWPPLFEYIGGMLTDTPVLSVSDLTRRLKRALEEGFRNVSVQGEISNCKLHTSGHLYFTLKDDASQIQ